MNSQDKEAFEKWFKQPVDQMLSNTLHFLDWLDSEKDCTNYFIEAAWQAALAHERQRSAKLLNDLELPLAVIRHFVHSDAGKRNLDTVQAALKEYYASGEGEQ